MVTPVAIENRLAALSKEVDEAQRFLEQVEKHYYDTKAHYEIGLARSRMEFAQKSNPVSGKNYTVGEREDLALLANEDLHFTLASAEASVRSIRQNVVRIRTQVDIARSIGTSVRASIEM